MIIRNIVGFLILFITPLLASAQNGHFVIKGKIGKNNQDKYIKLFYMNDTLKVVDSTQVKGGNFQFEGNIKTPTLAKLSLDSEETGDRIDFFLSNGRIRIVSKDSLSKAQIRGTELAESHEKFAKKIRPVDRKLVDDLMVFKNMPEGEEKKAYTVKVLAKIDEYTLFKRESTHQFVTENPNSYVALYHLDKSAMGRVANYETTFPSYDKLSPDLKATPLGQKLGERLLAAKGELTGQPYKNFISTTPEGDELNLKDILAENKLTLVDFWASWCGPCRKENPHVVKTYETFKSDGFTVLSVSLDNDKNRWIDAIAADGMPWYHVSSLKGWAEPAAQLYGVRAIPQNVLIDQQGKIVATNLRGETLYKKVEELLK